MRGRISRRTGCTAIVLLLAIVVGAMMLPDLWQPAEHPLPYAVASVPGTVARDAEDALAAAGHTLLATPAWAGDSASWRDGARYRLFFAARRANGRPDVYAAEVRANSSGVQLQGVRAVADTEAGEESVPLLHADWAAYSTAVDGYVQSVTVLPLADTRQPQVYVLTEPAPGFRMQWDEAAPAGAPLLQMQLDGNRTITLNPSLRQVSPEGALTYTPQLQGEFSWLPNLVSRVRELPGVGPEKIAFAENLFFSLVDWGRQTWYRIAGVPPTAVPVAAVATPALTGTPAPTTVPLTPSVAPAAIPERTAFPSSGPTPAAGTATVTPAAVNPATTPARPVESATPAATATATTALPAATPTSEPPAPATRAPGQTLVSGLVQRPAVRPDPQRAYAFAEVIEIDPAELQLKMIPGTWEPRPSTGLVGSGVIPAEEWPSLVASFNGGFAAMHGSYGMMVNRKVYLPARDGIATVAVYEDGSIRLGTWGKELRQTPDMISYRQNCPPLVENGTITAEAGKLTLWGLSISNEVYLYRSGLGVRADGKLVYVAGKPLSAYTLARALRDAGAEYAMQLDVDEFHVAFMTYEQRAGAAPVAHKLRPDMRGFDGAFLRPFQLDFFYLTRRAQPLAGAVRSGPAAGPAVQPEASLPALPGRIAFASNRDGNWELYAAPAGGAAEAVRLTQHPADDLYPAWSPDGRHLAFTSRRDDNAEIYLLELAGGSVTRVTNAVSEEWAPVWSPDGTQLAYQSDRNGQSDIYATSLSDGVEARLTNVQGNNEVPSWSPDGKSIAFDSDLDVAEAVHASINLYLMNADGTGIRRIYSGGESPVWSPDGRAISFNIQSGGRWQLFAINPSGGGLRQITRSAGNARAAAWSPDGAWIAYAGDVEGHWELYVAPAAGGAGVRLTYGQSDNSYPSWTGKAAAE